MIGSVDPAARPGDVVTVYERDGRIFGRAFYNPHSQIALRMLAYGDTAIDADFWRAKLQSALELRRRLQLEQVTDCFRLVHAEGDGLSGLIAEQVGDCLVFEHFALGMYLRRAELAEHLQAVLGPPPASKGRSAEGERRAWRVFHRVDDHVAALERIPPAHGPRESGVVTIREHGLRYRVDITGGHKTGFFCDQRDNRLAFARLCRGARVLDLCCYTGGFGIAAKVLGEAAEVTSVDLDEKVVALAKENANLNQARISHVHADAFIYLRQMIENKRQYDAVVLDPPKFARTRAQKEEALIRYNDLNYLGMQVVRPGGVLLTCSCSGMVGWAEFTGAVHSAARRAGRTLQMFSRTGAAPDHPVALDCPESQYLKALWLRVL
jgi:23S rRNA (cytosine1962-C5)-methyltransferase